MEELRKQVYEIVEGVDSTDRRSRVFHLVIFGVILINVAAMILETVRPIYEGMPQLFSHVECLSVAVFTVEYVLRMWCITANPHYRRRIVGRLRFALTPMALVDFLSVAPSYLQLLGLDMGFMRALRLLRMVRILKLVRYMSPLRVFARVLASKRSELLVILAVLCILMIFASTLIYHAERDAQPKTFSSIPAAMWWAIVTLTTVGYGDIYPITPLGKLVGGFIAVMGIGLFALPAGVLGSAFVAELQRNKEPPLCPHCGKPIHPAALAHGAPPQAHRADSPPNAP